MRIGEAAARAGVSRDTLRYYERTGLVPRTPRTSNGYREYSPTTVARIQFVRNALQFGFSGKQIAGFLRSRDSGKPPCHDVRAAGQRILDEMDRRIRELSTTRAQVERTLREWDRRLSSTPAGTPAHLLETIGPTSR